MQLCGTRGIITSTTTFTVMSDSNRAGDNGNRNSVSGGATMWGDHLIRTLAKGPAIVSISLTEVELYAFAKRHGRSVRKKSTMQDWGTLVSVQVLADASAALAIVERSGLAKSGI